MRAYHFIDAGYGLQNIARRRLKIARIHQLNDPFEWAAPANAEADMRKAFRMMKKRSSEKNGIICFSKGWQNPVLWSHYAAKHTGLCLGFDVQDDLLESVEYLDERIEADWESFSSSDEYGLELVRRTARIKFRHWEYEEEYRAFVQLDHSTAELGFYFLDFSDTLVLKEVIIGAYSPVTRLNLGDALDGEHANVDVWKARLAFQSFRVVRQKKEKQ